MVVVVMLVVVVVPLVVMMVVVVMVINIPNTMTFSSALAHHGHHQSYN